MSSIKTKIKNYPHFKIISDNGFQAFVHTNQYNDCGKKVDAVLVYSNGNIGDGKYGRPVAVIKGCDIDKIKNIKNIKNGKNKNK
tara:strand:+ start:112 stop:363 length:252 start_codon:yes stop_codon:yes gene_type:complete